MYKQPIPLLEILDNLSLMAPAQVNSTDLDCNAHLIFSFLIDLFKVKY